MAMYMCTICGKGVSSTDNHKCVPAPTPYNTFSKSKDNPFFVGYKPTFYFNTTERK